MIRKGQAPQDFSLLVGSGRVARHFSFYFSQLNLNFKTWSRRDGSSLREAARGAERVLLAVSDSALPSLIDGELADFPGGLVHFSGAFSHARTAGAHPLMSFTTELYDADFYPRIHFTVSGRAESLAELIPGLPNPFTKIFEAEKARYHALCVMGGNFPVLLWQKMENELGRLGLPPEATRLYIERVARNYARQGAAALTGPLQRKDEQTIEKNLAALGNDPWRAVYEAFREAVR